MKDGQDGAYGEIRHRIKQHHFLIEVAEGKITLEEFMAQLSDEQLTELLGGQPNTGVANTFGFGNLSWIMAYPIL